MATSQSMSHATINKLISDHEYTRMKSRDIARDLSWNIRKQLSFRKITWNMFILIIRKECKYTGKFKWAV